MKKYLILKDFEKALLFGLIFSVLVSLARFDASCEDLRKNVLRLHITANSDSSADQEVKLKIRDAILKENSEIFKDCKSLEIAENISKERLSDFTSTANRVLKENGFSYKAKARIGECYFPTREYDTFTLPAGNYNALNITLGSGKGHNWWCVIYPTVCIEGSRAKLNDTVSKENSKIAENPKKYKVKFKTVEIYESIKRKIKRKRR